MRSGNEAQELVEPAQKRGETVESIIDRSLYRVYHSDVKYDSFRHSTFTRLAEKEYTGKRFFDLCLSTLGFLVMAALYPVVVVGIKTASRGPVLYKQLRTGQHGREFTCYKFRTMHINDINSEEDEPVVTKERDRRIFGFGNWLRRTNLDELPQVINVLKGEMSIVGPRPYAVNECLYWNTTFEDHFHRYAMKPGITGYAQILGYRGGTLDEGKMRIRLDKDLVYVRKQSLLFDLQIVFETLKQMLHLKTNAH